jgi:hypothetical protein
MRLPASLLIASLLAPGALMSGCGASEEPVAGPSEATRSARCGADCRADRPEQRATHPAANAERCRKLLADVSLTYRITATPHEPGRAIGLRMMLVNHSPARLSGSTVGVLKVSPGRKLKQISWGGSSSDELAQPPGTTVRREIWHDRKPPGWHPIGTRVTSFVFATYAYGPGGRPCYLPATVLAPPGLVEGHSSGRWTQESAS